MQTSASFEESPLGHMAMEKAKDLFQVCDCENKGFIIKRDMQRLSDELPGLTPDQLEEVFDSLDQDGNGYLTMEEFVKGFGAFLGLQMPDESDTEDRYTPPPTSQESSANQQRDDADDAKEQFNELLEHLGASEMFKDESNVQDLWSKLRKDDPNLLNNFESFLLQVSSDLKKSKEDFGALESALQQRSTVHDQEIRKLYDEMEGQILKEKERVANEERQKAMRLREDMEREIAEKDRQLQAILHKHTEMEKKLAELSSVKSLTEQENDRLQKEREAFAREKARMERDLENTQRNLHDSKQNLDELKKQAREEKRERFKQTFKVTENIASERENLVQQLDMLRLMNKQLQDKHDESALRHMPSPAVPPPLNISTKQRPTNANYTIPKLPSPSGRHPDIEEDEECDMDEAFGPAGSYGLLSSNAAPSHGNSLLDELGAAMQPKPSMPLNQSDTTEEFNPSQHTRVDPIGAHDPTKQQRGSANGHAKQDSNVSIDPNAPERVFKVVFVGDSGVGKTCVLHRFCQNRFKPTFSATIGVDFQVKSMVVDNRVVALQLWDTAGQERFRSITKQYFRKADGVVLMYDVTSELSFVNLRNWVASVREGVEEGCVLCLLGNKVDLVEHDESRVLRYKDGQRLADEFGALFFETSAQTGEGITDAMQAMALLLREREDKELEKALRLEMQVDKKRTCCGRK